MYLVVESWKILIWNMMVYSRIRKVLLVIGMLESISSAYCGGSISKGLGSIVVGIATGGIGLAVGAPFMTAVTAGATAAIGAASGARTSTGIRVNGAGQPSVRVNISDNYGHPIADFGVNSRGIDSANGPNLSKPEAMDKQFDAEKARIASSKFSNWLPNTSYDVLVVDGKEYCRAKSNREEFLSLAVSNGWSRTTRDLIGTKKFENQPWNLTFETTPYEWYFDIVTINGKEYNHAYSDTLLDFLVPKGEKQIICAPDSFVEQYKLEHRNNSAKFDKNGIELSKMFFEEAKNSMYGAAYYTKYYMKKSESGEVGRIYEEKTFAKKLAESAMEYYQAAISVAETVNLGSATEAAIAFLVPGGIENINDFANGRIDGVSFLENIGRDIGQDFAVSLATGGIGGFTNRLRKATVQMAASSIERAGKTQMKTIAASRVTRIFGTGKFWNSLIVTSTKIDLGRLAKKAGNRGKIRMDSNGFFYRFDPAHQTDKIHLHKYQHLGGDKYKLIEEIDPETGGLIKSLIDGKVEIWG